VKGIVCFTEAFRISHRWALNRSHQGIPRLLVRGWINNGTAAIYASHSFEPGLLRLALPMGDDSWCEIRVPQPVIKLNVPEEYLLPTSPL